MYRFFSSFFFSSFFISSFFSSLRMTTMMNTAAMTFFGKLFGKLGNALSIGPANCDNSALFLRSGALV